MATRPTPSSLRVNAAAGPLIALLCTAPSVQALEGLKPGPDTWPRWQARLAVAVPSPASEGPNAVQLAGDHYFRSMHLGDGGGLRATGALLWGPRVLHLPAPTGMTAVRSQTLLGGPSFHGSETTEGAAGYFGIGYSSWWLQSGLGISADLGLVSWRSPAAVRLGRPAFSPESSETLWRTLQWTPVFQVALSYSF